MSSPPPPRSVLACSSPRRMSVQVGADHDLDGADRRGLSADSNAALAGGEIDPHTARVTVPSGVSVSLPPRPLITSPSAVTRPGVDSSTRRCWRRGCRAARPCQPTSHAFDTRQGVPPEPGRTSALQIHAHRKLVAAPSRRRGSFRVVDQSLPEPPRRESSPRKPASRSLPGPPRITSAPFPPRGHHYRPRRAGSVGRPQPRSRKSSPAPP